MTSYLSFARDEPPQLAPLQLIPVVHRTLKLMEPEIEAANVQLETRLPDECWVRGDAQRLQQLIMNLVLNSVQAMPTGGRLQVSLQNTDERACLDLLDSGPGIPLADRERVFEPFFTTKEKGSGLGLTVVRQIAEQHEANVQVSDGESGGARVRIHLPRLDGDNDEYFSQVQPASWRDFYLSIGAVAWLTLAAAYVGLTGDRGWPAMILIASVSVLLGYQTYLTNMFWNRSLN